MIFLSLVCSFFHLFLCRAHVKIVISLRRTQRWWPVVKRIVGPWRNLNQFFVFQTEKYLHASHFLCSKTLLIWWNARCATYPRPSPPNDEVTIHYFNKNISRGRAWLLPSLLCHLLQLVTVMGPLPPIDSIKCCPLPQWIVNIMSPNHCQL